MDTHSPWHLCVTPFLVLKVNYPWRVRACTSMNDILLSFMLRDTFTSCFTLTCRGPNMRWLTGNSDARVKRLYTISFYLLLFSFLYILFQPPSQFRIHSVHFQQRPSSFSANLQLYWSRFADVQYVTNSDYPCNSVMIFASLHRLGIMAEKLMMYPA